MIRLYPKGNTKHHALSICGKLENLSRLSAHDDRKTRGKTTERVADVAYAPYPFAWSVRGDIGGGTVAMLLILLLG